MNSTWRTEWYAIAAKIDGLFEALRIYAAYPGSAGASQAGINDVLGPASRQLHKELTDFQSRTAHLLPEGAARCLADTLCKHGRCLSSQPDADFLQARLTALACLRAEMDYLLADFAAVVKRMSERAFSHLRRSIVADRAVRVRWMRAFRNGEPACEKLGAVHLLLHGIWAFKPNMEGARTDLVFQDMPTDLEEVNRIADALVLTEWKRVMDPKEHDKEFHDARAQSDLYKKGALAGLELSDYRYLVMVSEQELGHHDDLWEGGVYYRHINIAVNPDTPSVAAPRLARS